MSPKDYFKTAYPLCLKMECFFLSPFLSALRPVKSLVSVSALGPKCFQTKGTRASAFVLAHDTLVTLKNI